MIVPHGDKEMHEPNREVSDAFWNLVEPLVPHAERDAEKRYKRVSGGGRKPLEARNVFSAIVYVLRTGIPWKALPKETYGSPSSIHRYFCEWEKKGFFQELWRRRLAEWDDMEGIAWEWRAKDDDEPEPPAAREDTDGNQTARGENTPRGSRRRVWRPVTGRRHQRPPA